MNVREIRPLACAQAEELLHAIEGAEGIIVATIERECEALRAGRMLAASALRIRLCDAAKLYLNAMRAARASVSTLERIVPGLCERLEERRIAFASLLKVELAVLATERAAAGDQSLDFAHAARPPEAHPEPRMAARRPPLEAPVLAVVEEHPRRSTPYRAPRRKAS